MPGITTIAEDYNITGYFTLLRAREHATDMPSEFSLQIEADGSITPMYFHRYKSKNTGVWANESSILMNF
ncbi:MAG: hypothetical protein WBN28_13195 [Lutimonas sp.]